MKIAVTVKGPDLNSLVEERFGRCAYFMILELDDLSFEFIQNPDTDRAAEAGVRSAGVLADRGVEVLLTGTCGPQAGQSLADGGIDVIFGVSGPVRKAVEHHRLRGFAPNAIAVGAARHSTSGGGYHVYA